jgi:Gas vesicle protein
MAVDPNAGRFPVPPGRQPQTYGRADLRPREPGPANLADILERVLDKGIVIAGDIQVNLLDIELLTVKIRLLVASVDRAREMGINWWESDPTLTVDGAEPRSEKVKVRARFEHEHDSGELEARVERLERLLEDGKGRSRSRGGNAQKR